MSIKALADYTQYSKYAKYLPEKKRRETWDEQVDRVFNMHEKKFGEKLDPIKNEVHWAKEMIRKKQILGSQRALQFGGQPILNKAAKIYNCTVSYVNRPRFFQECMYLLLCGCGTGFSVQKHHIEKLPNITKRTKGKKTFTIPDSIEGWADAIGVLMASYFVSKEKYYVYDLECELDCFSGYEVEFDFSLIRPEGSLISWGGKAPGPKGLQRAIKNITEMMDTFVKSGNKKLKPIQAYDIIMHSSDAVLSGGIRRSATICLFSPDDEEMINAKTGDWFVKNPQRGRSNNSALLIRSNTTKEQFINLMSSVKEFGEPGFVWADDTEALYNPCVEVGMRAYTEDGESGWQFCNLSEINGKKSTTKENFLDQCKAAAIIGTLQAAYDEFDYLTNASSKIVKREALLGVSITGMMDNPDIIFDPEIQKEGAKLILDINEKIAKVIGINKCARATCVKPAGCLDCTTEIKTINGKMTLIDIFEKQGYDYDTIKDLNDTWLELRKPLVIFNENNEEECVTRLYVNGNIITYEIPLEDGTVIKSTPWHKFKLVDGTWKRADELEEDDVLIIWESGLKNKKYWRYSMRVIRTPTKSDEMCFTLDLETEKTHTYQLGNGIVSHNTTSCILGSSSGVHPHHARRYFRRVQSNKLEFPLQHFQKINPLAVEESVWSNNKTDMVITFLCEVPEGARTKNQIGATDLLEHVKLTQQNWVEAGTRKSACTAPWLRHNVSNTINVKPEEWDDVENYIYKNRKWFAGISLLPHSGDKDYAQTPFCTVYTPNEMVKEYGDGVLMASGLIVDGLHAFDNNLWAACDTVLGFGENLPDEINEPEEPEMPRKNGYSDKNYAKKLSEYAIKLQEYHENKEEYDKILLKKDWIRRVNQFAERYVNGDIKRCTYLLKDCHNWKQWLDLKREYKEIDWSEVEEDWYEVDVSSIGGDACAGGKCELGDLGKSIDEKLRKK